MPLRYNGKILPLAREMRKNMTPHERHLWYDFLSNYPVRFQRQKVILNFIADFYCHQARLIIELDGSQHYTPDGKSYDAERTKVLEQYGLHILRFSNLEIDKNFDGVCRYIERIIKERLNDQL